MNPKENMIVVLGETFSITLKVVPKNNIDPKLILSSEGLELLSINTIPNPPETHMLPSSNREFVFLSNELGEQKIIFQDDRFSFEKFEKEYRVYVTETHEMEISDLEPILSTTTTVKTQGDKIIDKVIVSSEELYLMVNGIKLRIHKNMLCELNRIYHGDFQSDGSITDNYFKAGFYNTRGIPTQHFKDNYVLLREHIFKLRGKDTGYYCGECDECNGEPYKDVENYSQD